MLIYIYTRPLHFTHIVPDFAITFIHIVVISILVLKAYIGDVLGGMTFRPPYIAIFLDVTIHVMQILTM